MTACSTSGSRKGVRNEWHSRACGARRGFVREPSQITVDLSGPIFDRDGKEDNLASDISYKEQYFCVANSRLSTLIAFAVEVGQKKAATPEETELVARLRREDEEILFPAAVSTE